MQMDPAASPSSSPQGRLPPFFQHLTPAQRPVQPISLKTSGSLPIPIPGTNPEPYNQASPSSLTRPGRTIAVLADEQPAPVVQNAAPEPAYLKELIRFSCFDTLSPADIQAYAELIKKHSDNADFRQVSASLFLENLKPALWDAQQEHIRFRHLFPGQPAARMNAKTGYVACSIDQFKAALMIARKKYPALLALACNEEQNVLAARLIQVILCGEKALNSNLPLTSVAFYMNELHKQSLGPNLFVIPENQTYAFHQLDQLTDPDKSDLNAMKGKVLEAVSSFVKDNLERGGNRFQIGLDGPISPNGKGLEPGKPTVLETAMEMFVHTLRTRPDYAKHVLNSSRTSPFFQMAQALFNELPSTDGITFRESLERHFADLLRKNSPAPSVCKQIEAVRSLFYVPAALSAELAKNADGSPKEIETLILMKLLELITILQQGSEVPRYSQLLQAVMQYIPSDGESRILTTSKASGAQCCFLTPDCNTLRLTNKFHLHFTSIPKEVCELFMRPEQMTLATIEVAENVPSLTSQSGHSIAIFPIGKPRFSWKVSFDFIDFMAKTIPPSKQPLPASNLEREELEARLVKSCKVLEDIAKVGKGQILLANKAGSFEAVNLDASESRGLLGSFRKENQRLNEKESIEQLLKFIDGLRSNLAAYRRATIDIDEREKAVFLGKLKDKILNACYALTELWQHYFSTEQAAEKEALQQILAVLSADIACLLPSPQEDLAAEMQDWAVVSDATDTVASTTVPVSPETQPLSATSAAAAAASATQPRRSYLYDTASWVYGAVSPLFTPRTLTPAERVARFRGMRVAAPEVIAMVKDYLHRTYDPSMFKTLPDAGGKDIFMPDRFHADIIRLPVLKINGRTCFQSNQFDVSSADGKAAFLKALGTQCRNIQSELGLSDRAFQYMARYAHQQLVHDMTGRLMKQFEGVMFSGGLESMDFSLVQDKSGKKIKVTFQLVMEVWGVGLNGKEDYGYIGVSMDVLVPALEMHGNLDKLSEEQLVPHAEVWEYFSPICKTREKAQSYLP